LSERGVPFQPAVVESPDNTLLVGYWQSEKYFKDEKRRSDGILRSRPRSHPEKSEVAKTIGENAVSVHIRRGDYVSHAAANKFHGLLPLEYYERAAAVITDRTTDPHFFVISMTRRGAGPTSSSRCDDGRRRHAGPGHETCSS
jgi:hypothetical protein